MFVNHVSLFCDPMGYTTQAPLSSTVPFEFAQIHIIELVIYLTTSSSTVLQPKIKWKILLNKYKPYCFHL